MSDPNKAYEFSDSGAGLNFVKPLGLEEDPQTVLSKEWGRRPVCVDRHWVDASSLGLGLDDLDAFFRSLPPQRLFVRAPSSDPNAAAPRIELGQAPLRDQLAERNLHVVALDLHETDARYAAVMHAFLEMLAPQLAKTDRTKLEATCGLFLASGRTVVPFHADFEHNFLLHIYGEKQMHIFPPDDLTIFPNEAREKMASDMTASRFLPYEPSFEDNGSVIALKPGVSTYQPPLSPHWVVSSEGVTLSLLFAVFTSDELDLRMLHLANRALRKTGISPAPVGAHPRADSAKSWMMARARDVKRSLRTRTIRRGRVIEKA